ncbi:MAG: hypothetical protein WC314_18910 [Vulcanimicrobiota bacterium]
MNQINNTNISASKRRRDRRHGHTHQEPVRNPPKTRLGNGRVLSNGAGLGSDVAGKFMKSDI